jgi:hypothetical protein
VTRALCLGIAIAFGLAASTPAAAHREATGRPAPTDSIAIPNLTHGQMAVIARNQAAILDLAANQIPTDPTLRRLQGFINLQVFACLWGLMPGSVDDETSPFNECSHAYLAATRALLLHLQTMPGDRAPVRALIAKIEREMLDNNASLVLCRYSDEPFNTAERISPRWREIPFHAPSLIAFAAATLLIAGCARFAIQQLGRPALRT